MNKFLPILFMFIVFLINFNPIKSEEKDNTDVSTLIKLLNKKGFKIKNLMVYLKTVQKQYGYLQ